MLSMWLITIGVNLDHFTKVVFVKFHHKCLPFSCYLYLSEEIYYVKPTLKEWGVILDNLENRVSTWIIWNFAAWEI